MMKRIFCILLALMLLTAPALAEFDQAGLEKLEGCQVYMDSNGTDTIVRPEDQPYAGQVDLPDAELAVFLDYADIPDESATFLRLTLSLTSYEYVGAGEVAITVDGKTYIFHVFPVTSEYDMTYFEDYVICMTSESLPMIKAMARSKTGEFPLKMTGTVTVEGAMTLPPDRVAQIYDDYVDFGGTSQDLELARETWPVLIVKE